MPTDLSSPLLQIPMEKGRWPWQMRLQDFSCPSSCNSFLKTCSIKPAAIKLSQTLVTTFTLDAPHLLQGTDSAAYRHFLPCCPAGTGAQHSSHTFPAELPPPPLHTPPTACFPITPPYKLPSTSNSPLLSSTPIPEPSPASMEIV